MRRLYLNITVFLLFILLLFCFLAMITNNLARADPFLVCDPQTNVTHYVVTIDGITKIVPAHDQGSGTVSLKFDLEGISDGQHNVEVKAKNIWGLSTPVPFAFTKALPGAPENILIE